MITCYDRRMAGNFLKTLFRPAGDAMRQAAGSAPAYARMIAHAAPGRDPLTAREAHFLAQRDSFYLATRTGDGWPYIQHRGGPAGFVKLVDDGHIGFADYAGNKQYLSTSNLTEDSRVALFFMDYPNQRRLKMIGTAVVHRPGDNRELTQRLTDPDTAAHVERLIVISVVGWDWNCPQFITPRFTEAEVTAATGPLQAEIGRLRAELAAIKGE
jgi:predicted pyridoxine 5'-phosphate oxidase superfamily flavin-nucleotide-binding protein